MKWGALAASLLIVTLLVVAVVVLGVIFLSTNIFSPPDVPTVPFTRNDGYAAQQKLFEVASRQSGRSSRRDPIVITQPEANAFLSRHLEQSGLPAVAHRGPVQQGADPGPGADRIPQSPQRAAVRPARPLYLRQAAGRAGLGHGARANQGRGDGHSRHGSVEVTQFALGKQHLGSFLLFLLMGPSGGGLLQWPVPAVVDEVRVGDGQLFISTR